ncbi:hypothetical protein [Rhodococcus sp. (in: high G+C Gram-positive bacteria)]|uniref:hypothetical protein n=1 Tax=Rhodococcus sp. TaxID=1831 RepID=UPI00388DEBD9
MVEAHTLPGPAAATPSPAAAVARFSTAEIKRRIDAMFDEVQAVEVERSEA